MMHSVQPKGNCGNLLSCTDADLLFRGCTETPPSSPLEECARVSRKLKPLHSVFQVNQITSTSEELQIVSLLKCICPDAFEQMSESNAQVSESFRLSSWWLYVIKAIDPEFYRWFENPAKNSNLESDDIRTAAALLEMIEIEKLELGNSNYVFKVFHDALREKRVLLRVYGISNGAIDRDRDILGMEVMSKTALSPAILFTYEWGRVEEFIEDTVTSTTEMLSTSPTLLKKLYGVMQQMHKCPFSSFLPQILNKYILVDGGSPSEMSPSEYSDKYKEAMLLILQSPHVNPYYSTMTEFKVLESVCPTAFERASLKFFRLLFPLTVERFKQSFQDFVLNELQWMHYMLKSCDIPVVFSHDDLSPGNILLQSAGTSEERIFIVDYEYSDINYRCYDLANSFCELDYAYGRESTTGFVKPLCQKSIPHKPEWSGLPMEYPRLPILIYECWSQNNKKHPKNSLPFLCVEAIKTYFLDSSQKQIEFHHLKEVFLGMLASHIHWALWSFVMATAGKNSEGNSVGSGGLDYMAYGKCRLQEYIELKKWMSEKNFF